LELTLGSTLIVGAKVSHPCAEREQNSAPDRLLQRCYYRGLRCFLQIHGKWEDVWPSDLWGDPESACSKPMAMHAGRNWRRL